jgi:hypothetical protein
MPVFMPSPPAGLFRMDSLFAVSAEPKPSLDSRSAHGEGGDVSVPLHGHVHLASRSSSKRPVSDCGSISAYG